MPKQETIELAHQISAELRRFRGRGIDVEAMLTREDYAHDILQQCRFSGCTELKALAERFSELHGSTSASPKMRMAV